MKVNDFYADYREEEGEILETTGCALLKRRYFVRKIAEALYYSELEITHKDPLIYQNLGFGFSYFNFDDSYKIGQLPRLNSNSVGTCLKDKAGPS